jgi:hypothetical protein
MPHVCAEIEIKEDGSVWVGLEPPEEAGYGGEGGGEGAGAPAGAQGSAPGGATEGVEDKPYLKPAGSLDEALSVARDLLSGASGAQAQGAEQDLATGYAKAGGAMGQPQPPGAMGA